MHPLAHAILISWRRNRDYALRLVADVPAPDLTAQPMGASDPARMMNHPAWILAHLTLYAGVADRLIRGEPFPDPMDDRFGPRSSPCGDQGAYPSDLVDRFRIAHDAAGAALEAAPDAALARPTPLERWRGMHPSVGDLLVMLMVKHESGHLGQLSAWRRARGLPPVAQ
jgi:hypothetical protein